MRKEVSKQLCLSEGSCAFFKYSKILLEFTKGSVKNSLKLFIFNKFTKNFREILAYESEILQPLKTFLHSDYYQNVKRLQSWKERGKYPETEA